MTPIITYLGTDFRRRFGDTLPPCAGSFSSDVKTLGDWCADARGTIVTGVPEDNEGLHDLHLIVAQTTIINRFLRDQGFTPPDTMQPYLRDPFGSDPLAMLSDVADYYRQVAPLVTEPNPRPN